MEQNEKMARHVRAIYNYNVGQKAFGGKVLLIVGVTVGLIYFAATALTMTQQILAGLRIH